METLKNNKGYTLLLTVVLILLFAVLGLSLMSLTTNGIVKNEKREDITVATEQAEKGITFLSTNIQKQLEDYVNSNSTVITDEMFSSTLRDILEKNLCSRNNYTGQNNNSRSPYEGPISGNSNQNVGQYSVCIEGSIPNDMQTKRIINIVSTGTSHDGNTTKKVTSEVEIGASSIPTQLKYSVSTNEEGNLFLHGGIDIYGDVQASGNLMVYQNAFWLSNNSPIWQESYPPKIFPTGQNNRKSTLYLKQNKSVYSLKSNINNNNYNAFNFIDHYNYSTNKVYDFSRTTINENYYNTIAGDQNIKSLFGESTSDTLYQPEISYEQVEGDSVDVTSFVTKASTDRTVIKYNGGRRKDLTNNYLDGDKIYINGNVTLDGGSSKTLSGVFYVNGNVSISNTTLLADCVIFATGTITIKEAKITGLPTNHQQNKTGKFVAFSEGKISISNISEYEDEPTTLEGFFYSNGNLIMYGVGSNIEIKGGISAKDITLTALRGKIDKVTEKELVCRLVIFCNWEDVTNYYYPTLVKQRGETSRLQIIYDFDLIKEFEDIIDRNDVTFTTTLDKPKILNKQLE